MRTPSDEEARILKWLIDRKYFGTLVALEEESGASLHPYSGNISIIRELCLSGNHSKLLNLLSDVVPSATELHASVIKLILMEDLVEIKGRADIDVFLNKLNQYQERLPQSDVEYFVTAVAGGAGRVSADLEDWNKLRSRYELFQLILEDLSPLFPFEIRRAPLSPVNSNRSRVPSLETHSISSKPVTSSIVAEYRDESNQPIRTVAFSHDGTRLAVGTNSQTLLLCESQTLRPVARSHHVHAGSVYTCAWSSDDRWIATGSNDQTVRTTSLAQLQGLQPGAQGSRFQLHVGTVRSVAYTSDRELVVGCSADSIARLLDVETGAIIGRLQCGLQGHVTAVDTSGPVIAVSTSSGSVSLFDRRDCEQPVWQQQVAEGACVIASVGNRIAVGGESGLVALWDTSKGSVPVWSDVRRHGGAVRAVDFDRTGRSVASASFDATVRISSVASGQELARLEGHSDRVVGLSWRNSNLLASCGTDARVLLWSVDVP